MHTSAKRAPATRQVPYLLCVVAPFTPCTIVGICIFVVQVEAEEVEDLAERYDVSAVPHFLIMKVCSTVVVMHGCRSHSFP